MFSLIITLLHIRECLFREKKEDPVFSPGLQSDLLLKFRIEFTQLRISLLDISLEYIIVIFGAFNAYVCVAVFRIQECWARSFSAQQFQKSTNSSANIRVFTKDLIASFDFGPVDSFHSSILQNMYLSFLIIESVFTAKQKKT